MKLKFVLAILVLCVKVNCFTKKSRGQEKAFSDLIQAMMERKKMLTIFKYKTKGKALDAADSVAAPVPKTIVKFPTKAFKITSSAIVFLESIDSIKAYREYIIFTPSFSASEQIVVHLRKGTFDELKATETPAWISDIEYFLIEDDQCIRLLTFELFTPVACQTLQLVEVNRFNKLAKNWQHDRFKIIRYLNFHGCELAFLVEPSGPELFDEELGDNANLVTKCKGYVCALLRDISFGLNYSCKMVLQPNKLDPRQEKRKRVSGFLLHIRTSHLSVFHTENSRKEEYFQLLATRAMYSYEMFIAIPPGEEYDAYEKLVLPFDEPTWMWIAITFTASFATIFVLRFVKPKIANFMIGKGNETPVLNVIRAFFGISQILCPGRNFARYLLMMFILFSLIIRTAYQGKMFEFLQKEIRKPTVTTIDEMIEKNFTFYMPFNFTDLNNGSDFVLKANILDDFTGDQLTDAYRSLYSSGTKKGVFYFEDLYNGVVRGVLNKTKPPKLLPDRYNLESVVFAFSPRFSMLKVFDSKLQQFIEADLINYNVRAFKENNNPKKYEEFEEPFAVLTLGELEAGFVVCMVPLALSLIVFCIEWVPTMKNLIIFMYIFQTYFKVKEIEQENLFVQ